MDPAFEKANGHHLCLAGPLIDKYMERLGKCIFEKLGRKHLTGVVQPIKEFIPSEIFVHMLSMFSCYGCTEHATYKKKTGAKRKKKTTKELKKHFVWIENSLSSKKIFAPWRFDGTNYLVKRCFARKVVSGTNKRKLQYDGHAAVVVTEETPIRLEYEYKTNILKLSFTIQRYTSDGFAIDSTVQAKMNQE